MKKIKKILIARTDRLGDVLLSLHAVVSVREAFPEAEIDFLVRPELEAVLSAFLASQRIRSVGWKPGQAVERYDAALCLFDEPNLLSAIKRAGTPWRVGNYSKLRSFLKLTHGVRQRRALGKKNEGEYNLDLAAFFRKVLGIKSAYFPNPLSLPPNASAAAEARAAMQRVGGDLGSTYWMAHPGMGGSALNLGVEAYVRLLDEIEKKFDGPLYLSLGPAPRDLEMVEALVDLRPHWRVFPQVSLAALAEVYRPARLVVAPSTGPLHLAHYVGAPTLGIFSPVRSHQPRRWGAWGGRGKSFLYTPEHPCPGKRDCLGARCVYYFCLDRMPLPASSLERLEHATR